jgi:hypothetical protein
MQNFLIVGTQRTGSTALVRSLTFHPQIASGGEWVQHVPAFRKLAVAEQALAGDFSALTPRQRELVESRLNAGTKWLGFKVLFRSSNKWIWHPRLAPALWLDRLEGFRKFLVSRSEIRVIHIIRNDQIDWLKSKYLADRSKVYAAGRTYPEEPISIPIREAKKRLEAKSWIDARLATLRATNPYLPVIYEEFLESDVTVVRNLMSFLDCDPAQLGEFDYRKQQKQSKRSAREYISNYDRLVEAISA